MNLTTLREKVLYKEIIFVIDKKNKLDEHNKKEPSLLWQDQPLLDELNKNLKLIERTGFGKATYLSDEYKRAYKELHGFLVLKKVKDIEKWYDEIMPKINHLLQILAIEFLIAKIHKILLIFKEHYKKQNPLTFDNVFQVIGRLLVITGGFFSKVISIVALRKLSPKEKEITEHIQEAIAMFMEDRYIQNIEDYHSISHLALKKYQEMNNSYFASEKRGKSITEDAAWSMMLSGE